MVINAVNNQYNKPALKSESITEKHSCESNILETQDTLLDRKLTLAFSSGTKVFPVFYAIDESLN